MALSIKATGILLAGGKSKRMGTDKGLVLLNGEPLFRYALSVLESCCNEILISGSGGNLYHTSYQVIEDKYTGQGPGAGIHAALQATSNHVNIVLSVDLPFVDRVILDYLLNGLGTSLAAAPVHSDGKVEPLCAVYHKNALPIFEKALSFGQNKMLDILNTLNFKKLHIYKELQSYDHRVFTNINTPQELALAQQLQGMAVKKPKA